MSKNLYLLFGCTNHSAATVTQFIKMGVPADKVFVVDDDTSKFGKLSLTSDLVVDQPDGVSIPYFDSLIAELNTSPRTGKFGGTTAIFTNCTSGLWSKSKQAACVNDLLVPGMELLEPIDVIEVPGNSFVRIDESHGGKIANTLDALVGTPEGKQLFITRTADKGIYDGGSVVLQAVIRDRVVVGFDVMHSKSYFKDYGDITTMTTVDMDNTTFTPYHPELVVEQLVDGDKFNPLFHRFHKLANLFREAFDVSEGQISVELFTDSCMEKFFYIETNFRGCDIAMACSPVSWKHYEEELKRLEVI